MHNELTFREEGRQGVANGVNKIADAVKVTIGAKGRNVIIKKEGQRPHITKDGVTVASNITLKDTIENIGADLVKEVAIKTVENSGDGTSQSTIMFQSMINEGVKRLDEGHSPIDLKSGIEKATTYIIEELQNLSQPIDNQKTLRNIASISANNDHDIGDMIADAFEKVGKDGEVIVEPSSTYLTTMETIEGMKIGRGFVSPHFIDSGETNKCTLINPYIIIYDAKIGQINQLLPIMEKISSEQRAALIIAEDIKDDALALLVVNKVRGGAPVCAVKAPEFGEYKRSILEDAAIYTGGAFISDEAGYHLDTITTEQLGSCDKVVITRDSCTIIGGHGEKEAIQDRITQLKELKETKEGYEKNNIISRIAKLSSGVAVLKIGGVTESEIKEKADRIDDAIHATRAALEEGFIAGGGTTFGHIAQKLLPTYENESEKVGGAIVFNAILTPNQAILDNAGIINPYHFLEYGTGYNVKTGKVENLLETGVVDPTKVARVALENASSVAAVFLTTECVITEKNDK